MATGRPGDRAHHFGGSRVLAGMRVTAERTIERLYREQALGLLRFALLLTRDLTTAQGPSAGAGSTLPTRSRRLACRPG